MVAMVSSSRPDDGWSAWVRDLFRRDSGAEPAVGVLAEHRDVVQSDGVSISTILNDAEEDSGYLALPQRYEDRMEAVAEKVAHGVSRVRGRRENADA